jgi:hypothetical protein
LRTIDNLRLAPSGTVGAYSRMTANDDGDWDRREPVGVLRFVLFDGAHTHPFEVPDVPSALAVAERIVGPGDWAVSIHSDGTRGWSRGRVRLCSVSSLPMEPA